MTQNTITHEDAITYMLSGKATVGLHSEKTGNTFWYYVGKGQGQPRWNVYMHYDTKESDRYLFRIYDKDTLLKGPVHPTWSPLKMEYANAFLYTWKYLQINDLDKRVLILHRGTCGRCGRPLKDAESLKKGIGPECRKILGIQ